MTVDLPRSAVFAFLGQAKAMDFDLSANFDAFLKALDEHEKGLGFARVVALTRAAKATTAFLNAETGRVFDRPVAITRKAIDWGRATPDGQTLNVFVKDAFRYGTPQAKYLRAEILGGSRGQKRSEKALGLKGLMGNRGFWVPGPGVKLNAYGNVSSGTIVRILADLKAFSEMGYIANRTARSRAKNKNYQRERYFVPKPGSHLAPGVWVERPPGSRRILPALLFVTQVHYGKRFDFYGKGMAFATSRFPVELEQAMREGWHLPRATQKALGLGVQRADLSYPTP